MKLSTRLLVLLLPTVALVMLLYGIWAHVERERTLVPAARRETQAYATALALAFDYALRDVRHENVQEILNQISRAPTVYAILVYDSTGARSFTSDPLLAPSAAAPGELRQVLDSGRTVTLERVIGDQRVYSVIRPLHGARTRVTGALEVAQPLSFVEAEQARVRRRFVLNTLTLLVTLTLMTLWLVRRTIAQPLSRLVTGVRALGRGELAYRIVEDPSETELAELAREFNSMASSLEATGARLMREGEERLELERRLRESEKMAAIGKLAAGVAHEIAAPLNVISGRAEMVLKRQPEPPERDRNLRIIVEQIGRITTIVKNLLDFARRRQPDLHRIDVCAVLDGVIEFLDTELERAGVTLTRDERRPAWVRGDPDLLHQVFANLILNAVQAMEAVDGERRLAVRVRPGDSGGEWTTIEVRDTGPGIPESVRGHLFDPFVTTKPNGTGLGLAVARGIVEEHAGRLEASPAETAHGSVFRLVLPAADVTEAARG